MNKEIKVDNFNIKGSTGTRVERLSPSGKAIITYTLLITPDNFKKDIRFLRKYQCQKIILAAKFNFNPLAFLNKADYDFIESVSINTDIEDYSPLYSLRNLSFLGLGINNKRLTFDCSPLKNLEHLKTDTLMQFRNLHKLQKLRLITAFKFKEQNLSYFSKFSMLEEIELIQSGITTFEGIENLQNLNSISLDDSRKLQSLKGLNKNLINFEHLRIYGARKLTDFEQVGELTNLKTLFIGNVNEIKSVYFLSKLNKLEIEKCIIKKNIKILDDSGKLLNKYPLSKRKK